MLRFLKAETKYFFLALIGTLIFSINRVSVAENTSYAEATVIWKGGPDLVIPFFMPPLLKTKAGNPIYVNVITANIGNIKAAPTITRFYISSKEAIDPKTDHVLGEYSVTELKAEEFLENKEFEFTVPVGFSEGTYYLAACADANNTIPELNEENNCSFSQVNNIKRVTTPVHVSPNTPPVCDKAVSNITTIWPPNHKLVEITFSGFSDPDGDQLTTSVVSIHQDEPTLGLGDGDTSPDGFGIGTSVAQVRAERSGLENGRVYTIIVKATDTQGQSCNANIQVGVPHDKNDQAILDADNSFDSTK